MKTWLSRRKFLLDLAHVVGISVFTSLAACANGEAPVQDTVKKPEVTSTIAMSNQDTITATVTPEITVTANENPIPTTVKPSSTPTEVTPSSLQLLRNQNLGRVNIRFSKEITPVNIDAWRLVIRGIVENPQELTLDDVKSFPVVSQTSRLKCVEGWSFAAKWLGFHPQALFDLVKPATEAQWVRFYCADDYFESLEMRTLLNDRVLLAYDMNDMPLSPMHGAPLRLIVPFMYGYKGPKIIQKIVFADTEVPEDWTPVEKYALDGTILPGKDRALDLGITREFNKKGEIIYEQGLESLDN